MTDHGHETPGATDNRRHGTQKIATLLRRISPFHLEISGSEGTIADNVLRSMQHSVMEGALSGVMAVFIGGVILTGFALALGANEFIIGLIAALQAGANLLQMRAFRMFERRGHRKSMTIRFAAASRMMWIPICLLAFIPDAYSRERIWLFVMLFAVSVALGVYAGVPWVSWLVDLVPEHVRGRFFAQRNLAAGAVGIVLGIAAGKFIDFWDAQAFGPQAYSFVVLIMFGVLFGFRALGLMKKMHDPPMPKTQEELSFWQSLQIPFRDMNFRRLFYFRFMFDFSMGIAGTFYGVYMLQQVSLSFTFVSFLAMIATLVNFLSLRQWGVMLDRFGSKPILKLCLIGKTMFAGLWLFTTPDTFWLYVAIHMLGVFDAGNAVAIPNLVYKIAPVNRRANYIAVDGTMVGIAASISPLIGGSLAVAASSWSLSMGSFALEHFHFVFLAAFLLRLLAFRFLAAVHEPEAKSVTHVISVIRPIRSLDVFEGFQLVLHSLLFPARYVVEKLVERVRAERDDNDRRTPGL